MKSVAAALVIALIVLGLVPAPSAHGEGPCALLTTAEIQQRFPGSKPGQVDRRLEKNGILRCVWDYTTGRVLLIEGKDSTEPPKEEAKTWMQGFVDPLRGDAERHVRFETLAGVGDQAVAIVEREDKAKGILQNGALLVVRRGNRQVTLMAPDLARRERGEALRVLGEMGKAIARRLS